MISECSAHTKCDWLLFGRNLLTGTWLGLCLLGSWETEKSGLLDSNLHICADGGEASTVKTETTFIAKCWYWRVWRSFSVVVFQIAAVLPSLAVARRVSPGFKNQISCPTSMREGAETYSATGIPNVVDELFMLG